MTAALSFLDQVTPELLARHDRPGPRYTSYPTALEFTEDYTAADYRERLFEADHRAGEPLSLYVHVPFCPQRCSFCGCHSLGAASPDQCDDYLLRVYRELDLLAAALPARRRVVQYHWGGGTPTTLDLAQIEALHGRVARHFQLTPDVEAAVEVNPQATSAEQLALLRELGFNRLSFGIQDLDPDVLAASGRVMDVRRALGLLDRARELGFESVNFDLIYGLPGQTLESFGATLDRIVGLQPDRLAIYSFAHLPAIRPNQRTIDPAGLPGRELKFALFALALRRLLLAGYLQVGMDHFALPRDEMGRAAAERRLFRNFMGYTVHRAPDMVGVGLSAIGSVAGAFSQNHKELAAYTAALDEGRFPVERGLRLSVDDRIRQLAITELMCNFRLDFADIGARLGIDAGAYFEAERSALAAPDGPVEHGFVSVSPAGIEVTPLGRLFVRNVCMAFDRYLQKADQRPAFSRTI
ncbi:MAG TPA: oxygen-independent coproporphyrinogen III oxidase [Polyangia bacterium]|nr:oxygen-independent coproporphyrinogen III oxidase [Polyangia bacterium]